MTPKNLTAQGKGKNRLKDVSAEAIICFLNGVKRREYCSSKTLQNDRHYFFCFYFDFYNLTLPRVFRFIEISIWLEGKEFKEKFYEWKSNAAEINIIPSYSSITFSARFDKKTKKIAQWELPFVS